MKNVVWLLIFVLVGCNSNEPSLSINPTQLIGTWNSGRTYSTSERPYVRWTFEPDYVYTVEDTLKACQPLNNNTYYKYWIEGDILIMRYAGISNGLFPKSDIRRRVISITVNEIVLDVPRQVLEKCP